VGLKKERSQLRLVTSITILADVTTGTTGLIDGVDDCVGSVMGIAIVV